MAFFLARRLLYLVPVLIAVSLLTFSIASLLPGDLAMTILADQATPENLAALRADMGLDQPVWKRYFIWIGNVAQGDLGISLRNFRPVRETIMEKLPNTLLLTGTALVIALAVSIPIGVYGAVRRNSAFDNVTTATSVAGFSVPTFWLGLMLILLFAVKFNEWGFPAFPAGGAYDLRGGGGFFDRVEHLILPAFALAFVQMAAWTRYIRSQMLEVLNQDYMRTANAKGLRERVVIFRHGLRNAVLPLVTLLGIAIPDLFAGSLIIENIFTYPGVGQLAFNAAINKDYPLIMGITLVAGTLVIIGNLVADVVYSLLDPRIRLD